MRKSKHKSLGPQGTSRVMSKGKRPGRQGPAPRINPKHTRVSGRGRNV